MINGVANQIAERQGMTQRLRGMCNRLCGAGDEDMYKYVHSISVTKSSRFLEFLYFDILSLGFCCYRS